MKRLLLTLAAGVAAIGITLDSPAQHVRPQPQPVIPAWIEVPGAETPVTLERAEVEVGTAGGLARTSVAAHPAQSERPDPGRHPAIPVAAGPAGDGVRAGYRRRDARCGAGAQAAGQPGVREHRAPQCRPCAAGADRRQSFPPARVSAAGAWHAAGATGAGRTDAPRWRRVAAGLARWTAVGGLCGVLARAGGGESADPRRHLLAPAMASRWRWPAHRIAAWRCWLG
jgi:hypothetical protein